MGNDGGDIPGRKELVRDRKKVEPPSAESIAMGKYTLIYSGLGFALLPTIPSKNLWLSVGSDIFITMSSSWELWLARNYLLSSPTSANSVT
jgi:hypothetical protein